MFYRELNIFSPHFIYVILSTVYLKQKSGLVFKQRPEEGLHYPEAFAAQTALFDDVARWDVSAGRGDSKSRSRAFLSPLASEVVDFRCFSNPFETICTVTD